MKKTRRSLFTSLATLLLCSAMFVGSTFAWFTDTVSNTDNKIQAGTLKIGLKQYKDGDFVDISGSGKPIFDYNKWEPGYSDVALLKVTNKGNLALKYVLNIKQGIDPTTGEQSTLEVNENGHTLADAIWVYSKVGATTIPTAIPADADIDNTDPLQWHKTLLKDALAETDSAVHGVLLPNTSTDETPTTNSYATMAVILHMDEQAGNEYQGLSLGTSFDIELRATQYTYEEDGFGSNEYDLLADGNPDHPEFDVPSYPVTKLPIKTVVQEGGTTEVAKAQTINLPSGMSITYQDETPLTTTPTTETPGDSTNDAIHGFEYVGNKPAETSSNVKALVEGDPNKAVAQYDLTLPVTDTNTKLVKIEGKVAVGYINPQVFHNNVKIAKASSASAVPTVESFFYNQTTGEFTLWVFHSSPIEFVYDKELNIETIEITPENVDTLLPEKLKSNTKIVLTEGVSKFYEKVNIAAAINAMEEKKLENVTFTTKGDVTVDYIYLSNGIVDVAYIDNITFDGIKFDTDIKGDGFAIDVRYANDDGYIGKINILNCTFDNNDCSGTNAAFGINNNSNVELFVDNCYFTGNGNTYVIYSSNATKQAAFKKVEVRNSTFENLFGGSMISEQGTTNPATTESIIVSGCTFKNISKRILKFATSTYLSNLKYIEFTNNTLVDCTYSNLIEFSTIPGDCVKVKTGNTKDGVAWTPNF